MVEESAVVVILDVRSLTQVRQSWVEFQKVWRVLEQWMASKGLGSCARQLLKELDELHSMDVVLPTDTGVELRLRVVAQPEKELAQLLAHLGLGLPQRPKILANVVPKIGSKKS